MKAKLLIVVNVDWFFLSHRLPVALEAQRRGYKVHIATGITTKKEEIEKHGFTVHPLQIERGRASLFSTIRTLKQLVSLYREVQPDIVHLVTIKPVLLGGIAARYAKVPHVIAAISGLGFVFLARGIIASFRRFLVLCLYKVALGGKNTCVIFQNKDDRALLSKGARLPLARSRLIRGSGVDLEAFPIQPEKEGEPVVILASRLLIDKGVREFVAAARLLKHKDIRARMCLVGSIDPANPASLTERDLQTWKNEGVVELWGHQENMPDILSQAHIVVLPSYREGLPKVLIEAAACGRAVVTTDVSGCRDAIEPGTTGLLVPLKDPPALADALQLLIENPVKRQEMGKAGRRLAEKAFDLRLIVQQHIDIYDDCFRCKGDLI